MKVSLPDATSVLAHGRLGRVPVERPRVPDFAVYLDSRWEHDPEVTWPSEIVDWPDFALPADEAALFSLLGSLQRRCQRGDLVEIACFGGTGRTGTVLACLAVLAGLPADEAIDYVRENYHQGAVETAEQEELVRRFAGAVRSGDWQT